MTKKACCCGVTFECNWCDHDHQTINWYRQNHLYYNVGEIEQCQQANWNILGTLTTEIPSVGHVMTQYICRQNNGLGPDFNLPSCNPVNPVACFRGTNLDTYGNYTIESLPSGGIGYTGSSLFRTSSENLNSQSYWWGGANYYGEIYPSWFNGINMTNIENDDGFIELTFNLKIEKQIGSLFETVVDINHKGFGKNLRPHPDACKSYNGAGVDYIEWINLSECPEFNTRTDDQGNPLPCDMDFARMPRGPWPYKFKKNLLPDDVAQSANYEYPCRALFPDNTPGGRLYTREEVLKAKADPSYIGTVLDNGQIVGPGILECELTEQPCSTNPNDPNSGKCCTDGYCTNTEICYELDETGTPYGWEDVPSGCSGFSNYNSSEENTRFFCWWDPANRYTTPEWDVKNHADDVFRKMSIHVVVPTKHFAEGTFCYPEYGEQGRSFGEWAFGMDCEDINGDATVLESAGYEFSSGREQDGIWLNKTPTNALRLLFTLDHADLDQGKVWRAFRDWDVNVNQYIKKFKEGTPEEKVFRITIKQQLEEKKLSSLGCDCPSGYRETSDGNERIGPSACDDTWRSCDTTIPGPDGPIIVPGTTAANYLHCANTLAGTKMSFAERGPVVLNVDIETKNIGCIVCGTSPNPDCGECSCADTVDGSTKTTSQEKFNGLKMVIHSYPDDLQYHTDVRGRPIQYWNPGGWPSDINPSFWGVLNNCYNPNLSLNGSCPQYYVNGPQTPPSGLLNLFEEHGPRWLNASADMPLPSGNQGSPMGGRRYRNTYIGVSVSDSGILNAKEGWQCGDPLYGMAADCVWGGNPCQPPSGTNGILREVADFPRFNETQLPGNAPLGKCTIPCGENACNRRPCIDEPPEFCDQLPIPCPGGCWDGISERECAEYIDCPDDPDCSGWVFRNPSADCNSCERLTPEILECCFEDVDGGKCVKRCPEEPGADCYCTECIERTAGAPKECEYASPQDVDESIRGCGNGIGQFIDTDWQCATNEVQYNSLAGDIGCWNCSASNGGNRGEVTNTCFGVPDAQVLLFGMDSERIYLEVNGSNSTRGFVSNSECAKLLLCGCATEFLRIAEETGISPHPCIKQDCNGWFIDTCGDAGSDYGFGVGQIMINWRKFACQQRTKLGTLFDPDYVETFEINCNTGAEQNPLDCFDSSTPHSESPTDGCNHIWTRAPAACSGAGSGTPITPLWNSLCATASTCSPRNTEFSLEISKYSVPENDRGWLPFDTTYEANPNRNTLAKNRSHIIINAKGPSK